MFIQTLAIVVAFAFLGAVMVIVIFKLLAGTIVTRGLLLDKRTGEFSPSRLQLMLMTIAGAAYYFALIVQSSDREGFPEVPGALLVLIGASNATYLGSKIYSQLFRTASNRSSSCWQAP